MLNKAGIPDTAVRLLTVWNPTGTPFRLLHRDERDYPKSVVNRVRLRRRIRALSRWVTDGDGVRHALP